MNRKPLRGPETARSGQAAGQRSLAQPERL